MTKLGKFAAACAAVLCAFGAVAGEDFSQYAHKAYITFSGYAGESTLTNFPALVRIAEEVGGFSYADCALANGGDVRFSLGNGIELPSECVKWDEEGTSEFWVRVPELTASTRIMMFWGNAGAGRRTQTWDVWDATYTNVQEMNETGCGMLDSTRNAIHGIASLATSGAVGVAGNARLFNASYAGLGSVARRPFPCQPITVETWFKIAAKPGGKRILIALHVNNGNDYNQGYQLALDANGKVCAYIYKDSGNASTTLSASSNPTLDEWHHAMTTHDVEGNFRLYVDGVLQGEKVDTLDYLNPGKQINCILGRCKWGVQTNYSGEMDELRFSSVARSADYAQAVYQNATANETFLTIEAAPSARTEVSVDSEPLEVGEGIRYLDGGVDVYADGVPVESVPGDARHVVTTHRWKKQYKVSVSSDEWGTVTPAGEFWSDAGTTVDVSAALKEPDDMAHAFYAWGGNCPTLEVFSASFKLPVDCPQTISAKFGTAFYVKTAADGGSDDNDGRTPATAFATPVKAIETIDANAAELCPAVVIMGDGTWTRPNIGSGGTTWLSVRNAVAIKSMHGYRKTGINCVQANTHSVAVELNHPGAYFEGVAVTNAACNNYDIYKCITVTKGHVAKCFAGKSRLAWSCSSMGIKEGWVKECVIGDNVCANQSYRSPAFYLIGGLVVDCVFTNNSVVGGAVQVGNYIDRTKFSGFDGGILRNCLFIGNKSAYTGTSADSLAAGGVYGALSTSLLDELTAATTIENCTFYGNTCKGKGGGVYAAANSAVLVVNCAFGANEAQEGPDLYGAGLGVYGTVARGVLSGNGNQSAEAEFADAPHGNYLPALSSVARDTGIPLVWHERPGATDFAGSNRVQGVAVDAGALELTPPDKEPIVVNAFADVTDGRETLTVGFTSAVKGIAAASYLWEFGDGETATTANPTHVYAAPGYYTVKLTVTDGVSGETGVFEKENLIKVTADTVYVAAKGASTPTPPYASKATAAASLSAAYALKPVKIILLEGAISQGSSTISPSWQIEIVGQGPDKTSMQGDVGITLNAAGSIIRDLTFNKVFNGESGGLNLSSDTVASNCVFTGSNGNQQLCCALNLNGGTAVDCVFRGIYHSFGAFSPVVNIKAGGSMIDRCVITNNTGKNSYNSGQIGLAVKVQGDYTPAPVIRNSLIANNRCQDGYSTSRGAGIYSAGKLLIENCTIAANTLAAGQGAGVYAAANGVELVNTIVWDNVTTNAADNFVVADGKTATVTASCTDSDPRFNLNWRKNRPYWSIRSGLPCKDTGVRLGWMTDGATDLIGNPRVVGAPDMGCYENQTGGMMLIVR